MGASPKLYDDNRNQAIPLDGMETMRIVPSKHCSSTTHRNQAIPLDGMETERDLKGCVRQAV